MHIAQPAHAALGHQQALAVRGQVADDFIGIDVVHHRAHRHRDGLVLAGLAIHLAAHAVFTALGFEAGFVAEIHQGIEIFIGNQPNIATTAAIAAIGAAQRNEFLAPERNAAVAAIAGGHHDFCFVYEFHTREPITRKEAYRFYSSFPRR